MWKKIARNGAILVSFCVALLLLIQLGNWLMSARNNDDSQDSVSDARRLAYVNLRRQKFEPAIQYFDIVIQDDPYNGHATFNRAVAYRLKYYAAANDEDLTPEEVSQVGEEALAHFETVRDFPRFRNRALHSMSMINAHLGNHDLAIELLDEAFENGYVSDGNSFLQNPAAKFYYQSMLQDRRLRRLQGKEFRNFRIKKGMMAAPTAGGGSKRGNPK